MTGASFHYAEHEPQLIDGDRYEYIPGSRVDRALATRAADVLMSAFEGWPGFGRAVPPVDHLLWKLAKPGDAPALLGLTTRIDTGEIITTSVLVPRRYLFEGRPILVSDWCDAAVAPGYQGQGYYSKRREFSQAMNDDFDMTMNFSRNPLILGTRVRRGDSAPLANAIRTMVRPLSARRALSDRDDGSGGRIADEFVSLGLWALSRFNRARHRNVAVGRITLARLERFDERVDELSAVMADQFDLFEVRDAPTLNWRYCDPRGGEFKVLAAEEGERLLGYAVLAPRRDRIIIADLLAVPGRMDVVSALLDRVVADAPRGTSAVYCWLNAEHPYRRAVLAHGFVDAGARSGVNTRVHAGTAELETLIHENPHARIHLMHGNTDSI